MHIIHFAPNNVCLRHLNYHYPYWQAQTKTSSPAPLRLTSAVSPQKTQVCKFYTCFYQMLKENNCLKYMQVITLRYSGFSYKFPLSQIFCCIYIESSIIGIINSCILVYAVDPAMTEHHILSFLNEHLLIEMPSIQLDTTLNNVKSQEQQKVVQHFDLVTFCLIQRDKTIIFTQTGTFWVTMSVKLKSWCWMLLSEWELPSPSGSKENHQYYIIN